MKQQIRLRIQLDNRYINPKELDPRAVRFVATYRPKCTGDLTECRKSLQTLEFDWCNPTDLNHLNMANSPPGYGDKLCLKNAQNLTFDQGFNPSLLFEFKKCSQKFLPEGQSCFNETEIYEYTKTIRVELGFLHNYIDYENIENPV